MKTNEFSFVSKIQVTDDVIRTAMVERGIDPASHDARYFDSYNHPCGMDRFVEVLYRPGTGEIRWQQGDDEGVPALRPQDWQA